MVFGKGVLAGAQLNDFVLPAPDTAGIRFQAVIFFPQRCIHLFLFCSLLRLLGWREGQGIGPRMKRRTPAKTTSHSHANAAAMTAERQHSMDVDATGVNGDDEDEEATVADAPEGVTFAPRDVSMATFSAKDNVFGLGYRGLNARDFQLDTAPQRKGVAGFGVGALEDDDADIYHEDARDMYDREVDDGSQQQDRAGSRRPTALLPKKRHPLAAMAAGVALDGDSDFAVDACIAGFQRASISLKMSLVCSARKEFFQLPG
jgi:hypothetical protein